MKQTTRFYQIEELEENENNLFNKHLKELALQYSRNSNTLKLENLIPILGNYPVDSDSPDIDSLMEVYNARVIYGKKAKAIIAFLECFTNLC